MDESLPDEPASGSVASGDQARLGSGCAVKDAPRSKSPFAPHILVVDDDPAVIEAITAALKETYVVHGAATGEEACDILRAHPIAAILLDVMLGKEHGLDLVKWFRNLSPARILILTGHSSEDLAIRAVWAQADGYLKKPASVRDLHSALARLIPRGEQPTDLAAQARQYLDDHVAMKFCPAELAGKFGVSESFLRRCFRQAYGKTPRRYLTEVRMRQAATLLRTTTRAVEQVAQDVGFSNVVWFIKCFKRVYGVSATEYRASRGLRPVRRGKGSDEETP